MGASVHDQQRLGPLSRGDRHAHAVSGPEHTRGLGSDPVCIFGQDRHPHRESDGFSSLHCRGRRLPPRCERYVASKNVSGKGAVVCAYTRSCSSLIFFVSHATCTARVAAGMRRDQTSVMAGWAVRIGASLVNVQLCGVSDGNAIVEQSKIIGRRVAKAKGN